MSVVPAVKVLALVSATVGRRLRVLAVVLGVKVVDQLFYMGQLTVQMVELLFRLCVYGIVLLLLVLLQNLLLQSLEIANEDNVITVQILISRSRAFKIRYLTFVRVPQVRLLGHPLV